MDTFNPNCPECGIELDFVEHFDSYDEGDVIICAARGKCTRCGKKYQWDDVYELRGFQNLEEDY